MEMSAAYAWFIAGAIALAGITGFVGYQHGVTSATAVEVAKMKTHLAADSLANEGHQIELRKKESELAEAQDKISKAYEKGKADAEAKYASVVSELRSGNLRLQHRWAGCETNRLSESVASTNQSDAATRDREESAGRIVSAAAQCDAQVRGLQDILTTYRQTLNKLVVDSSRR
jgi:D-serine dehydratase